MPSLSWPLRRAKYRRRVAHDVSGGRHNLRVAEIPAAEAPHRDGTLIAGGLGYSLDELAALPPLLTHSSGHAALDRAVGGGLCPGSIWTLAASGGAGATTFAVQAAASAAKTGSVLIANGHVASHLLAMRLRDAADRVGLDAAGLRRIRTASWLPLPTWTGQPYDWDDQYRAADVVILDTVDEMVRPRQLHRWSDAARAQLRYLRELAQAANTAVVLTARTPPMPRPTGDWHIDMTSFDAVCRMHWASPVFADVSDVGLRLVPSGPSERRVVAYVRGGSEWLGSARILGRQRWLYLTQV